jgi:hypothetical protein
MADGHLSEAACLIEQGATYRRRVGLRLLPGQGEPIFAGFKPGAFAVYFGDAPFYHFDLEGRWQRAFVDGTHFLKSLDGSVQSIDRVREGANLVLKRNTLTHATANDFDSQVRSMARALIGDLDAGKLGRIEPSSPKATPLSPADLHDFLEQISRWNSAAWSAHRERYGATYGPMPFLPPECLTSVVLQATLGHTVEFGSGRASCAEPCRRTLGEFRQHARDVAALWGRRLLQARTIFLAGRDVLRSPEDDVLAYLNVIREVFLSDESESAPRSEGVHVFLDDFGSGRPGQKAWAAFAALGLTRVSVGVVSGDSEVRSIHNQGWSDEDLRASFADLKSAGIGASVLTLVGAGGVEHAGSHVARTAALITSLDLSPGDFVFLLDENELRDSNHARTAISPLSASAWQQEQTRLKEALAGLKDRKVKVLPYTMEKQGDLR